MRSSISCWRISAGSDGENDQGVGVTRRLRPGYLSEQYNVCGKAACRCKSDPSARHGPYYQLGWTRKRKSTSRFIHREDVGTVRDQVRNYKRLQKLVEDWIDASMELCDIKLKSGKKTAAKP